MHGFYFLVPHFFTRIRVTRTTVTPQIVADVLHVPRVEFLDYPSYERLGIMSKDELKYAICECPFDWGELQFTYCSGFAKGPRFLNMVMTFVFHPLSQSLVLDFCCPFLSILLQILLLTLFFLSQMSIGIQCPVISSFSLQLSREYYATFLFSFQCPTIFLIYVPQTPLPLNIARCSLDRGSQGQQLLRPVRLHLDLLHPHLLPPLLRAMCHSGTS